MRRSPVKLIAYQWLLLLGLVIFTGCSDEKGHQPLVPIQAEDTGKTGSKTDGTEQAFVGPSYEEILPILKDKCAACHVWHTNKAALDDAAKRGTLNSFISDLTKSPPAMAAMLSTTLKPQE
ncbi:MAG: hypothetical protein KDD40_13210, partial [Bdellovibrionales bacterium]|nr:hypothetical protein [Bdellovibrionales bacterium]